MKGALGSGHVRFKYWSLPFCKSPCHLCMEHSSEVGPWVAHPRLNLHHLRFGHRWNEKWRVGMHCSGCLFYWLAGHRCRWIDRAALSQDLFSQMCGSCFCPWNIWILWLPLHFCLSVQFSPLLFPSVSSSVSRPFRNDGGLSVHSEANDTSRAKSSSFRPLIWAYYADCGFGHVRSNVLIKILVNRWRHLLNT